MLKQAFLPGISSWVIWGDVFHGRDVTYGLAPSPYVFGSINGSTYIQSTAADQRKEFKVSYAAGEGTYRNRIMLTASSGLMKNGWAYTLSANKRWAIEGYRPGTSFDGYAYYGAVSKVKGAHQFNLTTFGAPLKQDRFYIATKEAFSLAGTNYYNPDWGYQTVDGQEGETLVQHSEGVSAHQHFQLRIQAQQ